ncbi:apolipoprotein N-acyltransferase [Limnohabitans lacus]|uniref:Apolipoprotein N-acyltransferase n=1 Tax=Limnohabitans lacus TaxID=3045173 RepID=A0ABT6XA73_9BURK|nr:apolipoprotein N-acyltransferase [Limnohabitans sp. HM2-2]MDI9235031.1 apolipoprotein N-acyltransferase [Limnohabitans sp. HM2-2]
MKLLHGRPLLWPALAGLAQAASIALPSSGQAHGWLQVLSLAILANGLMRIASWGVPIALGVRRAAWFSGVFATFWLGGSFWWLYVSMHDVGGLPAPLAALAVLALASAVSLFYAAAAAAWVALSTSVSPQSRPWFGSVLFAAVWTLAELMRGQWFTGFPWGAGGYAHVDGVLSVWAPWVGVYGLGFVAALLAMRLALTGWRLAAIRPLALVGLLSWAVQAWSPAFTVSAGSGQVELLQANITQNEKFDVRSGIRDALQWYDERLRASQQALVVAPETAIPLLRQYLPEGYWPGLQKHFAQPDRPLALVGVPLGSLSEGYANAVVALGPEGQTDYRYDKHHLVPFGEFIPPGFGWFVRQMQIPLGDFSSGRADQPSITWQGQRLSPNICYEDLFGEELAARFKDGAKAPTVLVNVSNIAWFGNTLAVDQHLNISRMRAMELGRPMLRATNTGATAIIDHQGRVTQQLPRFTRGTLVGSYEGRTGLTPYARWAAAWGLLPLWGLCGVIVLIGAVRRRLA